MDLLNDPYYPKYVHVFGKRFMKPELSDLLAMIIENIEEDWIRGDGSDENRHFWADRIEEAKSKLL